MSCAHNDEFECFDCSIARHDAEHPEPAEGCLTCRLRTIQISPQATPTKRNNKPPTWHENRSSWERGIATDVRHMPLLDSNLSPIPIKTYGEKRHEIEEKRRRLRQDPSVTRPKE